MPSDQPARYILCDTHKEQLRASGISPAVSDARGYWTEHVKAELRRLGFSSSQQQVSALVLPLWGLDGEAPVLHQIRPDKPRIKNGRTVKYETPYRAKKIIDVPPLAREKVLQASSPLFITEGVKKADAAVSKGLCCVALLDVWAWKNQEKFWDQVPLIRRAVYIVFDSDICTNKSVQLAAAQLKVFLQERQADVQFIILPGEGTGNKVGLDDFLASGQGEQELLRFACADLPFKAAKSVGAEGPGRYRCGPGGIFREIEGKDGEVSLDQLTNFPARIVAELLVTDGMDSHREFEIEATVGGRVMRESVPADKFAAMWWVEEKLGAEAVVFPGSQKRDYARAAIQELSIPIPQTTVYTHLGWVIHEGKRYFAHGGGLIGADPQVGQPEGGEDRDATKSAAGKDLATSVPIVPILRNDVIPQNVRVQLPEALALFVLPEPPSGDRLIQAIQASLKILELGPDRVVMPLYAAIGRAPLGAADYSLYVVGKTGNFKSEVTALDQQHYGREMNRLNLPANWNSTANGNLDLMFRAKDVPLTMDDWLARGSRSDVERANRDADTILRAQGNRSGRVRCNREGTAKAGKRPRCFLIVTGEDTPEGNSLHPRFLPLPLAKGEISAEKLTGCQTDAAAGLYAEATAAYLRWLIPYYDAIVEEMKLRKRELRGHFADKCLHPRIAENAADLLASFEIFLTFAEDVGAIDEEKKEFARYFDRLRAALEECIQIQNTNIKEQDPVEQFLQYVASALLCGRAHLCGRKGGPPEDTGHGFLNTWGWEEREEARLEAPEQEKNDPKDGTRDAAPLPPPVVKRWPKGDCIGWIEGGNVYLDSKSVLAVAQQMARDCGQYLAIGPKSLGKVLDEGNHLESKGEPGSDHPYTIRFTTQGGRPWVYHIHAFSLIKPAWWNDKAGSADFGDLLA